MLDNYGLEYSLCEADEIGSKMLCPSDRDFPLNRYFLSDFTVHPLIKQSKGETDPSCRAVRFGRQK